MWENVKLPRGLTLFLLDRTSLDLSAQQPSFLPNTLLISWTAFQALLMPRQSMKSGRIRWRTQPAVLQGGCKEDVSWCYVKKLKRKATDWPGAGRSSLPGLEIWAYVLKTLGNHWRNFRWQWKDPSAQNVSPCSRCLPSVFHLWA